MAFACRARIGIGMTRMFSAQAHALTLGASIWSRAQRNADRIDLWGAFKGFAHAARSYSCKSPPRRSRRFSVIGCVSVHGAVDVRPFDGAKSRLR